MIWCPCPLFSVKDSKGCVGDRPVEDLGTGFGDSASPTLLSVQAAAFQKLVTGPNVGGFA